MAEEETAILFEEAPLAVTEEEKAVVSPFGVNEPLTAVTGTVSATWAAGTFVANFVGQTGVRYDQNGKTFTQSYSGTLSAGGALSVSLPPNESIQPKNSQWRFHICAPAGSPCFDVQVTISGPTQDISTQLQAAAPPLVATATAPVVVPITSSSGNFTVAHGMGRAPVVCHLELTAAGSIYFQATYYDATNLYLVGSGAGITGRAKVW